MRHLLTITLNNLRVFFADRGNILSLLVLPIGFTLVLGVAQGGGSGGPAKIRIDLIDQDTSAQSADLIAALREANETLVLCPADEGDYNCALPDDSAESGTLSVEQSQQRVADGISRAAIVIPAGYGDAVQAFEPVTLDYYTLADFTSGDPVRSTLNAVVARENAQVVAARVGVTVGENFGPDGAQVSIFTDDADRDAFAQAVADRAGALLEDDPVTVAYSLSAQPEEAPPGTPTSGFQQSVPGMGAMFVMFTVLGAMVLLIKERRQWTLQRLVVMPVARWQILGGKALAYFVLGIIQYGIVFAVGVIAGTDLGSAPVALLLVMVAFVLCITALTFALATQVTSLEQANGIALLLSLTLAPLGGAWWPLEIVPDFMQTLGHLSPVAWAMDGFNKIILYGGGVIDVLPEVGVLLAATAVLFGLGVWGFRYDNG